MPSIAVVSTGALDGSQTTLTFAQQTALESSTANCVRLNNDLQRRLDAAVRDYNANMESGIKHDPPFSKPIAPRSWMVLPPDANGMQWFDQTGPFLTPTPPLTLDTQDLGNLTLPDNPPGTMVLGNLIPGTGGMVYQALKGDTCAEGTVKTVVGPDGNALRLRKHNVPWGGYWEVVV